jgi:hypothetical protein
VFCATCFVSQSKLYANYVGCRFKFDLLEALNLFVRGGSTAVASHVVTAAVGGHMVHQSVYEHQTARHLPPFPS